MLTPHDAPAPWTLLVLVAVVAVKETLFRIIDRAARTERSSAARADAWHHRADAFTSALAFIGVAVAVWGPGIAGLPALVLADEAAALIASGVILLTAYSIASPAWHELMDAAPGGDEAALIEEIRRAGDGFHGVRLVEKVHARKSGRGYHVDLHLHVDPELTVREAHAIAGRFKAHLRDTMPSIAVGGAGGVLVHIEPAADIATAPPPSTA